MSTSVNKLVTAIFAVIAFPIFAAAHNGNIANARPLGQIKVDGHFSDWPLNAVKYPIASLMSDAKPKNDQDFSGFFQVGYRMENKSLYIAFTITDDDFIQDSSKNVRWNSQDGLELSLDARHLFKGSGVASFMYSKTLRNINKAFYDPFAKNAIWEIMEVALVTRGSTRYYEWRIQLGNELEVGKSVGFDFTVFDKDSDDSFSFTSWGMGESKYINPNSLGDVLLLPSDVKLETVSGKVTWDKETKEKLPHAVVLSSISNPRLWIAAKVDSMGNYSAAVPAGQYNVRFQKAFFNRGPNVYATGNGKMKSLNVKRGQKAEVPVLTISGTPVPDLLPEKGVLHEFNSASEAKVDEFIKAYQQYYDIPGVSLALIKDGKMVYHKTYGLSNTMTGDNVNANTLFEAASITKPVFAFAVQRLAERGEIDLEKPLWLYLPNPDIEYDERYKLITAKHVLTHRTGFPNWRSMNENGELDLKFTPGSGYGYSGEGFEYLKKVVEKITAKKVEQVLQEEVIQPMGLYHTFFSKNDSLQRLVAYGHFNGLPSNNDLPESPGMAYSMHTEARIFSRFMLYLMEQQGLKPETYDTMFQKHSEYDYPPDCDKPRIPAYMGMSLEVRETPYGKSFGHGGNNGDFKCQFEVYKDTKMGYAIFTNSNTSDVLLQNLRRFLIEGKDE